MKKTVFNWEWTVGTFVLMSFENLLHAASTPKDIIQKKLEQLSVTIARIETLFAPSASKLKIVSKPKLKVHSINSIFFHHTQSELVEWYSNFDLRYVRF